MCTVDAEAKAGKDYEKFDEVLNFQKGEKQQFAKITINDDDNWEPDKDFFIQLYGHDNNE